MIDLHLITVAHAGPLTDAPAVSTLLTQVMNYIISIFGAIAVLMVIVGGIAYMTANGDLQQVTLAKKIIVGAVIGMTVALLAWVIVNTIVTLV